MPTSESSPSIFKVVEQPFVPPPRFIKMRTVVFGCVFALSFLWTVLLCVVISVQWSVMDVVERYLVAIMLLIQFFTLVLVPLLMVKEFQAWLDAARSFLLFAAHFGVAVWFIAKAQGFKCSSKDADQMSICNIVIIIVLAAVWVIPTLVLGYAGALAYLMRRVSKMPLPSPSLSPDLEKQVQDKSIGRVSFAPTTHRISTLPQTPTTPASMVNYDRQRRQSAPYSIHSNASRVSRPPLPTPVYDRMQARAHVRSLHRTSAVPYPPTPTTPQTPNVYGGIQPGRTRASTLPTLGIPTQPRQVPPGMYYAAPMAAPPPRPYYGPPPVPHHHQPRHSVAVTPITAPQQQQQQQQRQQKTSSQQSSVYSQASYGYAA